MFDFLGEFFSGIFDGVIWLVMFFVVGPAAGLWSIITGKTGLF